ncbi:MAG: prenyltransferase/squalene oxidase repeat-containing protein [Deltaproteobacteria bacterium]
MEDRDLKSSPTTLTVLKDLSRLALRARAWRPSHARVPLSQVVGRGADTTAGFSDGDHFMAAARWLASAQDAMRDGGVAAHFSLRKGWSSSYPETTGYLIPTFLRLAKEPGLETFEERGARAVEFLLRCQLPEGAFFGGRVKENTKRPSVFNSAQIICGLVAWHRHTKDQRVLDSAVRAGDWLVSVQDADGGWRRHVYHDVATSYTAHASCWLAELGEHTGEQRYRNAALRHLEWVLALVDPETGWFDRCGFTMQQHEKRTAFTHTIAYTLSGVLMTSQILGIGEGIACVERAAGEVASRLELLRWLPGVLDSRWRRRANFACVTGTAQMGLIWMQLFEGCRDVRWMNAAMLAIDTVKSAQEMRAPAPGLLGGIPGSDPVWGDYMRLAYPNWAAKFFIDALLEKRRALALGGAS